MRMRRFLIELLCKVLCWGFEGVERVEERRLRWWASLIM